MRWRFVFVALLLTSFTVIAHAQSFEVVSVRPSQRWVGPDYDNQVNISAAGFTARNVTLTQLIADAWQLQFDQVIGPEWLSRNEYDVSARLPDGAGPHTIPLMLRSLLADRFGLKQHQDTRPMLVYELTVAPGGPRIHPSETAAAPGDEHGFHFHGTMRRFADLLTVQFSIPAPTNPNEPVKAGGTPMPVLDKTGLEGTYDFTVHLRLELGTDAFTAWKSALDEQLGLKVDSRKADVPVIVVDEARKIPTAN